MTTPTSRPNDDGTPRRDAPEVPPEPVTADHAYAPPALPSTAPDALPAPGEYGPRAPGPVAEPGASGPVRDLSGSSWTGEEPPVGPARVFSGRQTPVRAASGRESAESAPVAGDTATAGPAPADPGHEMPGEDALSDVGPDAGPETPAAMDGQSEDEHAERSARAVFGAAMMGPSGRPHRETRAPETETETETEAAPADRDGAAASGPQPPDQDSGTAGGGDDEHTDPGGAAPVFAVDDASVPEDAADTGSETAGRDAFVRADIAASAHTGGTGGTGEPPRWTPLIVGENTQEIPVHLLFRDEAEALEDAGGPVRPAPAGRRWGTGEQPRIRRAAAPAGSSRAAPPGDPRLAERPGPALPGWAVVIVGLGALLVCVAAVWWIGAVPDMVTKVLGLPSNPYHGIGIGQWALLSFGVIITFFTFGGLGRGRVGQAWVLTLFGDYRGSVRRTGLLWVSPLLVRRKVDVRLRHWRSEPMPAVDSNGTELRVVVLVVWRVRDTVRAALGVENHEEYLRQQVEAAMARVLSQLPTDAFHEEAPTLRNAEAVGDALTRMLSAECRPIGVDVFSAQPTRIEYAPEIAAAMQRSRIAAIDAKHRDGVLTAVVDAVDDTVNRLTSRGLVELDDYERKALVKDLTVAFYTGRQGPGERL
ncbi:SPFH domain-containing protein [Streptomyces sp. AK02-01A]|uniref:SPFH domain-containing protein n=1 Tax=Streptomyces sp. AK02-01A TaxID=3028648 RepID=UPI0029A35A40|nr:SPFH domain-containing protein [Streptomyces sp. AK02-01A]MDX3849166.1 SPFH domain-containing protein [Streptomyces sp. AK02-01A]